MSEEGTPSRGRSAHGPGVDSPPSPEDPGADAARPSAVASAHTTTTVRRDDAVTISGPQLQQTLAAIGEGAAPDATGAGPTAASPARTPPANDFLPRRPLTRSEALICFLAIAAWVILTAAGVAVSTKPYIDLISGSAGPATILGLVQAWFLVITCYTFTNIAFLCCLSAVIGAIGRSAQVDDVERHHPATDLRTLCVSGVIRGFFMYIVILSGTLILSDQKYDDITIEQYLKLAGLVSLLSFAIGYDPQMFVTFFERVTKWTSDVSTRPPRQ